MIKTKRKHGWKEKTEDRQRKQTTIEKEHKTITGKQKNSLEKLSSDQKGKHGMIAGQETHNYTGAPIVGIARWSVPRIG